MPHNQEKNRVNGPERLLKEENNGREYQQVKNS
jgi:hypothetical protein